MTHDLMLQLESSVNYVDRIYPYKPNAISSLGSICKLGEQSKLNVRMSERFNSSVVCRMGYHPIIYEELKPFGCCQASGQQKILISYVNTFGVQIRSAVFF